MINVSIVLLSDLTSLLNFNEYGKDLYGCVAAKIPRAVERGDIKLQLAKLN